MTAKDFKVLAIDRYMSFLNSGFEGSNSDSTESTSLEVPGHSIDQFSGLFGETLSTSALHVLGMNLSPREFHQTLVLGSARKSANIITPATSAGYFIAFLPNIDKLCLRYQ